MAGPSLMLASRLPIDARGPIFVEQQIERAGIGGEITPEQPTRFQPDSPGPFQPNLLHPYRRPRLVARQEVEQSAGGFDDADIGQARREFLDKSLFVGKAESYPQTVPRPRGEFVDLCPQRIAPHITAAISH